MATPRQNPCCFDIFRVTNCTARHEGAWQLRLCLEPNKYLVPIDYRIGDLQNSLTKKIATWSAERKGAVLGSASELGRPLEPGQALSALDLRSGVECLQLRFTLDDGARVELFLGARASS
ncbi:unnamed protein product [Symbiodinium sp. KB8]|nr:unnamed protein product [Symbiodinium sp. KB8]